MKRFVSVKALIALFLIVAGAAAQATTYWLGAAAAGGTPPACFKFYSDEACQNQVSITPTANDGNTYVVLGSAKMQGSYTAPAGTTWIFGTDGQNVGTKKVQPKFNSNGYNQKLGFGNCTIYGIGVSCAADGISNWNGVNTFVNVGQGFFFTALSCKTTARGVNLSGTFLSADDVTVSLGGNGGYGDAGSFANFTLSGDFTAYKGKFTVSSCATTTTLALTSASAFGDAGVPASNYLTVNDGVTLTIDPAVTQYATKGITFNLAAAQTAYVRADAPWTLIAPISGSTGTLAKTGDGALTLATSVEMKNLSVDAGTLIVDTAASFAEGTTLTVKSGAKVVSRVGSKIPNVTLVVEPGGSFSYDFTVPYDGTTTTPLTFTDLTAEDRAALTKPIAITLSKKVPLPQNNGQTLAVAKFSVAAGFEAADFSDGTDKTYGLPNTSFTMSEPENGVVTLTMNVKPVITRTGGNRYAPLNAQFTYASSSSAYTTTPVWSDGLAAHDKADYVHANGGEVYSSSTWDNGTQKFLGDSLYLTSVVYMKSKRLELPPTVLAGGWFSDGNGSPAMHTYAGGPYTLASDVSFYGSEEAPNHHRYTVDADLRGTGNLNLSCSGLSTNPSYITGDNSGLKGKITVTHRGSPSGTDDSARLEVGRASSLGGAMDAFATDGIMITKYSIVRPQQTMTLDAVNRGITIDGFGGFEVLENNVLTLANPVRLSSTADGALIKMGKGSLALNGAVTCACTGTDMISVMEGWLRVNASGLEDARVEFAAGAGLEIDVQNVAAGGLTVLGTGALSFADAKLAVRFANTDAAEAAGVAFTVPICTLSADSGLTVDSFACARPCRRFGAKVRKEELGDGKVRFFADCSPKGLMLIFR